MVKVYRFLLVLVIIILIISGLNISNRGINSLTLEDRQPVLALLARDDEVKIFTLGQTHTYSKQEMRSEIDLARQRFASGRCAVADYLFRFEKIVRAYITR